MKPHTHPLNEPQIVEMPPQNMAAVYARGLPGEILPRVIPTLYNSLMALKFERSIKKQIPINIHGIRARFPDAHRRPVADWTTIIGVPLPEDITSVPQQVGGDEVKVEVWEYGTVAQILHDGTEFKGKTAREVLYQFVVENGFDIIGMYEEEYFSDPDRYVNESIIRYRVRRRAATTGRHDAN